MKKSNRTTGMLESLNTVEEKRKFKWPKKNKTSFEKAWFPAVTQGMLESRHNAYEGRARAANSSSLLRSEGDCSNNSAGTRYRYHYFLSMKAFSFY